MPPRPLSTKKTPLIKGKIPAEISLTKKDCAELTPLITEKYYQTHWNLIIQFFNLLDIVGAYKASTCWHGRIVNWLYIFHFWRGKKVSGHVRQNNNHITKLNTHPESHFSPSTILHVHLGSVQQIYSITMVMEMTLLVDYHSHGVTHCMVGIPWAGYNPTMMINYITFSNKLKKVSLQRGAFIWQPQKGWSEVVEKHWQRLQVRQKISKHRT